MFRLLRQSIFLLLFIIISSSISAQVFWTEDFNTGPGTQGTPANGYTSPNGGWAQSNLGSTGAFPNSWYVSDQESGAGVNNCGAASLGNPTLHVGNMAGSPGGLCPTGDCGAAYDASAGTETIERIESPIIDCSGQTTITLSFDHIGYGEPPFDGATVLYSDDAGATWNPVVLGILTSQCCCLLPGFCTNPADPTPCTDAFSGQGYWQNLSYVLPASCDNNATVQIGFLWVNDGNNAGSDPSCAIDDVTLSGTATTCDLSITSGINSDETCLGAADGQIDVTFTGTDLYNITIGATTYYSGVGAGVYNISPLADGTYTVTVTSTTDPTCTEDVIVIIAQGPASGDATITAVPAVCENDLAFNLVAATGGGTWTGTGITNGTLGTFDPAVAGAGPHTITYTITGACGDVDTEVVTVNAADDASFTYVSGSYCLTDPNPTPTATGTGGGTFTIDLGGSINPITGEINIGASGANSYTVTYTTTGACPDIQTFGVTLTAAADATINLPIGPYCESDAAVIFTAVDLGGTWTGTGITNGATGNFDPAVATPGIYPITYTITGTCGDVDVQNVIVNADQDASFTYLSGSFCLADPNPFPTLGPGATAGGTYTIDLAGTIDAVTGEIDIASSGANAYVVTYTTPGPCADVQTFNVTLTASADATITTTSAVCANAAPFNLTAVSGGGTWSGTGITDAVNGTFDPSIPVGPTVTITYTITGSCGAVDTEVITINPADDATFSYSSPSYCLSDPNPFATVGGTGGGVFTIDNSGTINAANGQVDLVGSGAGNFIITYTTLGACPDTNTFSMAVSASFDATITAAGPFCTNDPAVNLVAVDPGGTWTGTGITSGALGTFDPAAAGAGSFVITYDSTGSCGSTDTETIIVNASDDASFSYSSATFCDSDSDPSATISGTFGGLFTISAGGSINSATGVVDLGTSGVGTYTVTYTTTGVCPDSQTFGVTVTSCVSPGASFTASDALICEGDCITFTESSSGPPTVWLWTFPGGTPASASTQDPGIVCFNIPGTHDVQLIVTNAFGSDTTTVSVQVNATPVVSAGGDENIIIGESIDLTAIGTGGTYTWTDPTTLSCAICQTTTASPTVTTGYLVTLTDSAGCTASDSITVNVTYIESVGVPSAFSPNGDGNNDVLYVKGAGFATIDFKVYNRYGQLMFETQDQSIGWDGTFNSKGLNPGTFAYILEYTFIGTVGGTLSGTTTLIK
jgi:gliding motility-associated-like protein